MESISIAMTDTGSSDRLRWIHILHSSSLILVDGLHQLFDCCISSCVPRTYRPTFVRMEILFDTDFECRFFVLKTRGGQLHVNFKTNSPADRRFRLAKFVRPFA
jgi:hypothetical protein